MSESDEYLNRIRTSEGYPLTNHEVGSTRDSLIMWVIATFVGLTFWGGIIFWIIQEYVL